jgi:hypothetical protein
LIVFGLIDLAVGTLWLRKVIRVEV